MMTMIARAKNHDVIVMTAAMMMIDDHPVSVKRRTGQGHEVSADDVIDLRKNHTAGVGAVQEITAPPTTTITSKWRMESCQIPEEEEGLVQIGGVVGADGEVPHSKVVLVPALREIF